MPNDQEKPPKTKKRELRAVAAEARRDLVKAKDLVRKMKGDTENVPTSKTEEIPSEKPDSVIPKTIDSQAEKKDGWHVTQDETNEHYKDGILNARRLRDGTFFKYRDNGTLSWKQSPHSDPEFYEEDGITPRPTKPRRVQATKEITPETILATEENVDSVPVLKPEGVVLKPEEETEELPSEKPDSVIPKTIDAQVEKKDGRYVAEDGTVEWYDHGELFRRELPDGTFEHYREGGSLSKRKLPDGTSEYYGKDGKLSEKELPDGTIEQYKNGILFSTRRPASKILNEEIPTTEDTTPEPTPVVEESIDSIPVIKSKKGSIWEDEGKEEKGVPAKTPEEEVADFISEFNLKELLPPGFADLNEAQALKVVQDLKQRIVDIVKTDAQTQYSEYLKTEMAKYVRPETHVLLRTLDLIGEKVTKAAKKETDFKNLEGKVFAELKNSEEGKKLIAENLATLVETNKGRGIQMWHGKPFVTYVATSWDKHLQLTEEEKSNYGRFNGAAMKYASLPYEWGQEAKGAHKKEYDKAKAEYEQARDEILKIKASRETPGNKGQAMLEMLKMDNELQMEQLLHTHPEFEKALSDFEKGAGGKEWLKTGGSFLNTITGGGKVTVTNKLIFAGGYGAKMLATIIGGSAASTTALVAAPLVGATVGGLRANIRAKDTLSERGKSARHGQKDESAEAANVVDAEKLSSRLADTMQAFSKASSPEEQKKLLDQIKRRIEFTRQKIEGGLVNFGDAKTALSKQFDLVNNLNQALVVSASLEQTTRKDIDARVERFLSYQEGKIEKAQGEFIKTQTWRGIFLGTGAAFAGYGLRNLGEHSGFFAHHAAATEKVPRAGGETSHNTEGLLKRAEDWMEGLKKEAKDWIDSHNPFAHHEHVNPSSHNPASPSNLHNNAPATPVTPNVGPVGGFHGASVTFEHGHGGIREIEDLQNQLSKQYPDMSKAPQSIQDFVHADATKEAIKLGFYNPNSPNESALIKAGSVLRMDEHGNLLFGHPDASGHMPELNKDEWTMFHSGQHLAQEPHTITSEAEALKPINASGLDNTHLNTLDTTAFHTQYHVVEGGAENHAPAINTHHPMPPKTPEAPIQPPPPQAAPESEHNVMFFGDKIYRMPEAPRFAIGPGENQLPMSAGVEYLARHHLPISIKTVDFINNNPHFVSFAENNHFRLSFDKIWFHFLQITLYSSHKYFNLCNISPKMRIPITAIPSRNVLLFHRPSLKFSFFFILFFKTVINHFPFKIFFTALKKMSELENDTPDLQPPGTPNNLSESILTRNINSRLNLAFPPKLIFILCIFMVM